MIVGENYKFGDEEGMGRGSVTTSNYSDQDGQDVFGLGDGDCSCPVLNYKNVSMVVAGGLIAYWGINTGNAKVNTMVRLTGGVVFLAGLFDIVSSYMKKSASSPMPMPQAKPADPSKQVEGLGSEWYTNVPTNAYLNRFANALRTKCKCSSGMGDCYSCMG